MNPHKRTKERLNISITNNTKMKKQNQMNINNNNVNNNQQQQKTENRRLTMIKHIVGKVRSPSYTLPSEDFVFGIPNQIDKEGAGKVLQSWSQSERSEEKKSSTSYVLTNRNAITEKCLTAKSQREYALKHPVRIRPITNTSSTASCRSDHIGDGCSSGVRKKNMTNKRNYPDVFGLKSQKNDATMKELFHLFLYNEGEEERDYPDRSGMQKKGRLPPAKSTKSSRLLEEKNLFREIKREQFKMKKFVKNARPKIYG